MKGVYFDLHMLERYVATGIAKQGVALVMNDMGRLVNPGVREGKCWDYDTSYGARFGSQVFNPNWWKASQFSAMEAVPTKLVPAW